MLTHLLWVIAIIKNRIGRENELSLLVYSGYMKSQLQAQAFRLNKEKGQQLCGLYNYTFPGKGFLPVYKRDY
jgi:hypothetical protein